MNQHPARVVDPCLHRTAAKPPQLSSLKVNPSGGEIG